MASAEVHPARETWSAGNYDAVAERIWGVGADLVGRLGIDSSHRVLDVACGTGNAAVAAAQAGARVTGLDITPELFPAARRRAAQAGVEIELVEGDAEHLPFEDAGFDAVVSTFGCMFAPDHRRAGAEIVRVVRPGGRVGIVAWRPDGGIGDFLRSLTALAPPPPPDFQPPPLWGTRDHAAEVLGDALELAFDDAAVEFRFDSLEAAVDEYYEHFGPAVMLRRALKPEGREEEVREALRGSLGRIGHDAEDGFRFKGEYLITRGARPA